MIDVSNEYTFQVKIIGEKTKKTFEGSFTVKCILDTQESIDVGLLVDQYNRGSKTVPPGVMQYNRALAEMDLRIVRDERTGKLKAPSWWIDSDGARKLLDKNVLLEVFLKTLDAEKEYDKRVEDLSKDAEKETERQTKKNSKKEASAE